ncbi:MAG: hypothetical protein CMK07_10630 [Ponticaulis sp.]|nr:hypothetical protein [Ponticaulis sp.]
MVQIRAFLIALVFVTALPVASADDVAAIVEKFGSAREAFSPKLSEKGDRLAVGCAPNGHPTVCVYDVEGDFPPRLFGVPDEAFLSSFYWASDKHVLIDVSLFEDTPTGDGIYTIDFSRSVSFDVEKGTTAVLYKNRAEFYVRIGGFSSLLPATPDRILKGDYELDLETGKRHGGGKWATSIDGTPIRTMEGEIKAFEEYYPLFVNNDARAARGVNAKRRTIQNDLYELKNARGEVLFERDNVKEAPLSVLGFSEDGADLIVWADFEDTYGLKQFSLTDGAISAVHEDPDVDPIFDPFTRRLVGLFVTDNLSKQEFFDPALQTALELLRGSFPDDEISIVSWSGDRQKMVVGLRGAGRPVEYHLFDLGDQSFSPLAQAYPSVDVQGLSRVEGDTFTASDGTAIEMFITHPNTASGETKAPRLVILPHGGPEARDTADFDWYAQALAARGYLVLQPNYRGSSGYGRDFRNKGYGELGGKVVQDIIDAADWATGSGLAREGGFCVVGFDAGGYLALQTAALGGEKIECSIAINSVADPLRLMKDLRVEDPEFYYWSRYFGIDRFSNDAEVSAVTAYFDPNSVSAAVLTIHAEDNAIVRQTVLNEFLQNYENEPDFKFVSISNEDHYLRSTVARQTVLSESLAWLDQYLPAN